MVRVITKMAKRGLVAKIQYRYLQSSKKDKWRILDEFTAITCRSRKHSISPYTPKLFMHLCNCAPVHLHNTSILSNRSVTSY